MAANTSPIFLATPQVSYASTGTAANTNLDGTGTVITVFTAGANGSKVETVSMWNMGTNVSTVVRFFVNNGNTNATASNNALVQEFTWASNSVVQNAASTPVVWQANLYLPANYKLNVTIGTAIAAGIMVAAQGGNY